MVKVGDKVRKSVTGLINQSGTGKNSVVRNGTVVWVHPTGRFYVAEFRNNESTVRECYPMKA